LDLSHRDGQRGDLGVQQNFSVGKHRAGRTVDVHVRENVHEVWDGAELVKGVLRTSKGAVRKKGAGTD